MRREVFLITLVAGLLLSLTASAQNERVSLRVPGFVRPLAEKWVAEYQKANPGVDFLFLTGKSQDDKNTITLTTQAYGVGIARYAVLPVTTRHSEAGQLLARHRLNARRLRSLFFVDDEQDAADDEDDETNDQLHIFIGNSQSSASRLLAAHFKEDTGRLKGRRIQGDDQFLTAAISRDPLGVTVTALPNLYDLDNRRLHPKLALLPLALDREGRQALGEGYLDDVIQLLERHEYDEIPIGTVSLTYDPSNVLLADFVQWVQTVGTGYVHQYGLLALPHNNLAQNR